ncbi:carbon monoxide dehydrogenase [Trinickia sp. LjRoot230]|uniref:CoxG family protein n=1 Tax=Trinickia sp. LjRoot230 TaxID=3342288 RepID=UPI003ECDC90D
MELTNALRIPLDITEVANALSDTALVRASLENCESFARLSSGEYAIAFTVPVGPLRARYDLRVHVAAAMSGGDTAGNRQDEGLWRRVLNIKASAPGIGSLRGQVEIVLDDDSRTAQGHADGNDNDHDHDNGTAHTIVQHDAAETVRLTESATRIEYAVWATSTGPLAALPPRQIENALLGLAEDFFAEFAAVVETKHGKRPNRAATAAHTRRRHVFLRPISLARFARRAAPATDEASEAAPGRWGSLLLGHRAAQEVERRAPRAMPFWVWAAIVVLVAALLYVLRRLQ